MLDYKNALARIHEAVGPRIYLEIGVRHGDSLRLAGQRTLSIAVDPEMAVPLEVARRCHLERMTSDEFFAGPRVRELLGAQPIDMAFIDGMHLFEYALRDFINIEANAGPRSVIVLHDCLPRDAVTAARERTTDFWTGDVWKLVLCLMDYRPELELSLIDAGPSGLCLIGGLKPGDSTLGDEYSAIVERYVPMGFECWESRRPITFERLGDLETLLAVYGCSEMPKKAGRRRIEQPKPAARLSPVRGTQDAPRLLGVLLCYNDADILADVIDHLADNGHDIIAWDHGSTDDTGRVLDRYRDVLVERRLVPREFDFYQLYPEMSRHLISQYSGRYDWVSWPDDDEILEGPDRCKTYQQHLVEAFALGYSWIRFDNFNYWVTEEDDTTIESPVERIRRYCVFPECAPRIRSWRMTVTNMREFNHNSLQGQEHPARFRLRHYPARTYAKLYRRIFMDRANLQRGIQNVHYNRLLSNLSRVRITADELLYDDHVSELSAEVVFDWLRVYGEPDSSTATRAESAALTVVTAGEGVQPHCIDDLLVNVARRMEAGDRADAVDYYAAWRHRFAENPQMPQFDLVMAQLADSLGPVRPADVG